MDPVLFHPIPMALVMVVWALAGAISARREKLTRVAARVTHRPASHRRNTQR